MYFKKHGFPKEGEIIICTVKRIQRTTVFLTLDEYEHKEGIIHISEISPGRIRTIRDYVKEGKKVVCKVLRKNERYGNLDLSLRRVTTGQRLKKLKDVKLEEKSEKIIESVTKQQKLDFKEIYEKISNAALKDYESISQCFQDIAEREEISLEQLGIDKKISQLLEELIKVRLKPQEIKVARIISMNCPGDEGVEIIKSALKKAKEFGKKNEYNLKLSYISAPKYSLILTSSDPKRAESEIEEVVEILEKEIEKNKGEIEVKKPKK
jgi:translation initiation factor 2 subunit 1